MAAVVLRCLVAAALLHRELYNMVPLEHEVSAHFATHDFKEA